MALDYELTKQFFHAAEKIIARFAEEKDAFNFMEIKADWDHKTKVGSIYRLYKQGEVIKEMDSASDDSRKTGNESSAAMSKHSTPTPLPTAPRPSGLPSMTSVRDDDDDFI